jgi:hypothetical protein
VITLMQDDNKLLTAQDRKPAKLTKRQIIFRGALVGGASSLMSVWFLSSLGLGFPVGYLLLILTLGVSIGAISGLLASYNEASRWVIFIISSVIGLLIPICLIETLFLLSGL